MKNKKTSSALAERRDQLSQSRGLLRRVQAGKLELARLTGQLLRLSPFTKREAKGRAREILRMRKNLLGELARCEELLAALEKYIGEIEDCELRRIFTLRYIHAYPWRRIAFAIGKYEESYPRKRHDRYIEKCIEEGKDLL